MDNIVRPAAVAGMFYPGVPEQLALEVGALLAQVERPAYLPKALIVPHAGYIYSGPVAAAAYACLAPLAQTIRRVVMLAPAHRLAIRGLATSSAQFFRTPLGDVPIDEAARQVALGLPQVQINDAAHAGEHAIEVHLPFLQSVLERFSLLPFVVGMAADEKVAAVLELLWGGSETLILISSDLSHYHPYAEARRIDSDTVASISRLHPLHSHEQACGATPINGLLAIARRRGLSAHLLDLNNSGDTAGDKARVVGYASFAFTADMPDLGTALLVRARNAIAARLGLPQQPEGGHDELQLPGATFVTLTKDGQLRGCIGSLEAHRKLDDDVRTNAVSSAFSDPRFRPVIVDEWPQIKVEVSLLTPTVAIQFGDEADAMSQLRPGVDGVIFACNGHRSTFLPQVWEQLPQPQVFMARLKQKAGLPADFWSPDVKLFRYEVQKWKEH